MSEREIGPNGLLTLEQLEAVRDGNWRENVLFEPLARTALFWYVERLQHELTRRDNRRLKELTEMCAEWEEHEVTEAQSLYARLNRAGETRDFPEVVLCALRWLCARTEEPKP